MTENNVLENVVNQAEAVNNALEEMSLAIVGHVDHGKSTLVGRLLADTHSLPEGKLDQVKEYCRHNAKPFEYAFLLDALKVEQAQGITLDTARCFFHTQKRRYIILDTPGHLEFLKNMVTGASRAEAALLIIDAEEGVKENSYRHGYMLSLLGVRQVAIVVNKMDLVDHKESAFNAICEEYLKFLKSIDIEPIMFIPVSAREGDNIVNRSPSMDWYQGKTVVECIDHFSKEMDKRLKPFRFPVHDVYKFTAHGDTRRIVAGTIDSGEISMGDEVLFSPSGNTSTIKTIEQFNVSRQSKAPAGQSVGFTLNDELFISPGEVMSKVGEEKPATSSRFKANIFWLGNSALQIGKQYKLKLCTANRMATIESIVGTFDAASLERDSSKISQSVEKNHIAECIVKTTKPIAFDLTFDNDSTSRFVLVDGYEIAGGGIICEVTTDREAEGAVSPIEEISVDSALTLEERLGFLPNKPSLILLDSEQFCENELKDIEKNLLKNGRLVYSLCLEDDTSHQEMVNIISHLLAAGVSVLIFGHKGCETNKVLVQLANTMGIPFSSFNRQACDASISTSVLECSCRLSEMLQK